MRVAGAFPVTMNNHLHKRTKRQMFAMCILE
jgi:hypothetical protein